MTLTYQLIPGGYRVLLDGKPWVDQPFDPSGPGMLPFVSPEAAEAAAQLVIAEVLASQAEQEA